MDLEDVIVHAGITAAGQLVLRFMSEYQRVSFNLKKGKNVIQCNIDSTMLTGGVYSIDCSILYQGREATGHIDEVYDATTFVVADLQVPGTNEYLSQKEAAYYIGHSWTGK